jgi:DtxR family transcriptional regulator, Mn-dependent transcriptional regulator
MNVGSSSVEDYLKAIYQLQREGGAVSTTDLAHVLHITSASVTGMLKRLAVETPPLVTYHRYRGVSLTAEGERLALATIRRHRLLELFLQRALDYPWDEVHAEAERLEHAISEQFEDRIAAWLGNPAVDPHGDPIPTKQGTLVSAPCRRLSDLADGEAGTVMSIADEEPALLRYAAEKGLVPGASVQVAGRLPFGGPLVVSVGERPAEPLGKAITDSICVSP